MAKTFRQMVREARGQVKVITPRDAKPIVDQGGAMLIDVREAWEIAQHGTISGARNITRGELDAEQVFRRDRRKAALRERANVVGPTVGVFELV